MIDAHTNYSIWAKLAFQIIVLFKKDARIKFCGYISFQEFGPEIKITFKTKYFIASFIRGQLVIPFQHASIDRKSETQPFGWCPAHKKPFAQFDERIINVFNEGVP